MARPLRIEYPGAYYHLTDRGVERRSIFTGDSDFVGFLDIVARLRPRYAIEVVAYCLMPNHYHLLIQTPGANLSRCMRHVNGVYTQRFNRNHLLDGQLFRGRYKAILIEVDSYLLELLRYIHRNPLEAGLVTVMDKYPWGSHQGYLSDAKKWRWLYKDFILSLFSDDKAVSRKMYKGFVSKGTPEEINQIFGRKNLPSALGRKDFLDWVKSSFFSGKRHKEVPESKNLSPDAERIKEEVCRKYGVAMDELHRSRRGISNEPRNVAIYLLRSLRGDNLEEIGREFNITRFSSVSSVVERMRGKISADRQLRNCVEEIKTAL